MNTYKTRYRASGYNICLIGSHYSFHIETYLFIYIYVLVLFLDFVGRMDRVEGGGKVIRR